MAFDFLEISKLSLQLKIDFEHEVEIAFELTKKLTILSFVFVELLKPHSCGLLCPVGTCLCISV
jgi:hypothetical protein